MSDLKASMEARGLDGVGFEVGHHVNRPGQVALHAVVPGEQFDKVFCMTPTFARELAQELVAEAERAERVLAAVGALLAEALPHDSAEEPNSQEKEQDEEPQQ